MSASNWLRLDSPVRGGANASCLNCRTTLTGRYCSRCGQREAASRFRWRDLARDVLGQFADLDHPWLRTIRDVTIDPGGTARAFVDGRRVVYVSPLKYAFYALLITLILSSSVVTGGGAAGELDGWHGFLLENTPVFVLLMVPVLAVALRVIFLRAGLNLLEVSVFSLYMIAQLAFAMLILGYLHDLGRLLGFDPDSIAGVLMSIGAITVAMPVYFMYGVARFFRVRITWALIGSLFAGWFFVWTCFQARLWLEGLA